MSCVDYRDFKSSKNIEDSPFGVVICFNSLIENCNTSNVVFKYADIGKIFNSSNYEGMEPLEIWKLFVEGSCELTSTGFITNSQSYYEDEISARITFKKAEVVLKGMFSTATYFLSFVDGRWLIYDIVYS
jgi:hypothetical protein